MVMTTETKLVTDLGRLHVRPQGPVTAGIWLVTGDTEFPMVGWSDFAVVILGWWMAALLRLLRNESRTERVHFMDGPYAVEISRTALGTLHFRMLAGRSGGHQVATGEAEIRKFICELTAQSQKLLDECKVHGWWSADADELTLHLKNLDVARANDWTVNRPGNPGGARS